MVRAWAAVAVLLLLAGCTEPGGAPQTVPPQVSTGPLVVPFGLEACLFAVAVVDVDAAALAAYLPPGFEPLGGNLLPGLPLQSFVGLEAFVCDGEGLGDAPARYPYGSVFTGVRPDPRYEVEGVEEYYVKWDTLVANASKRAALGSYGVAALDGDASLSLEVIAGGAVVQAEVALGAAGFSIEGVGTGAAGGSGFTYVEYVPAADGALGAWHGRTGPQGEVWLARGSVVLEGDSWVRDLLGPGPLPARIVAGEWSFPPGNITVPVGSGLDVR